MNKRPDVLIELALHALQRTRVNRHLELTRRPKLTRQVFDTVE